MKLKYAILDIKARGFNKIKKVFSSNYKIDVDTLLMIMIWKYQLKNKSLVILKEL